jgi:hypothetical protein
MRYGISYRNFALFPGHNHIYVAISTLANEKLSI